MTLKSDRALLQDYQGKISKSEQKGPMKKNFLFREHTKEEKLPRTFMENKREIVIHVCDETRYLICYNYHDLSMSHLFNSQRNKEGLHLSPGSAHGKDGILQGDH